ncbi:hypothetical protein PRZ48_010247 [Zasmidium cellare]|uniref:Uncharacterized protein n=1 Tax=Zasmidium cellare TaxID=395010 RepID=A0ABR0E8E1_ZASCE|nr:hypothetical protein PRZ48_010247 [Zasmidium cellare]
MQSPGRAALDQLRNLANIPTDDDWSRQITNVSIHLRNCMKSAISREFAETWASIADILAQDRHRKAIQNLFPELRGSPPTSAHPLAKALSESYNSSDLGETISPAVWEELRLFEEEAELLNRIQNNEGHNTRAEALIFMMLRASGFAVRAFEFGALDGGITCDREFSDTQSYSDRLLVSVGDRMVMVEVKKGLEPGSRHNASAEQQNAAGVFLIAYSDCPDMVVVLPNMKNRNKAEGSHSSVYYSRVTSLQSSRFKLDPTLAYHAMRLVDLPEAFRRLRRCAVHGEDFVNPYTGTKYGDWRPPMLKTGELLQPKQDMHKASFARFREIKKFVEGRVDGWRLDMIFHAPELADMKLIDRNDTQVLIRHKREEDYDRVLERLTQRLPIQRTDGNKKPYHYFCWDNLFDLLWYDVVSSGGEKTTFIIPWDVLPMEFYDRTRQHASFDREEFRQFQANTDDEAEMISLIERVLHHPLKRRTDDDMQRLRDAASAPESSPTTVSIEGITSPTSTEKGERSADSGKENSSTKDAEARKAFRWMFYEEVMKVCSNRRHGALVPLANNDPSGDFCFVGYSWTEEESQAFDRGGPPPMMIEHISADVQVLPLFTFSQAGKAGDKHITVSNTKYRRWTKSHPSPFSTLALFDRWSAEDETFASTQKRAHCPTLVLLGSDEINPGQRTLELYSKAGNNDAPLWRVLPVGPSLTAYLVCRDLPSQTGPWEQLVGIFSSLTRMEDVTVPPTGRCLDPSKLLVLGSRIYNQGQGVTTTEDEEEKEGK